MHFFFINVTPDIYILKVGDDYEILQNEDGLPKLRINCEVQSHNYQQKKRINNK